MSDNKRTIIEGSWFMAIALDSRIVIARSIQGRDLNIGLSRQKEMSGAYITVLQPYLES